MSRASKGTLAHLAALAVALGVAAAGHADAQHGHGAGHDHRAAPPPRFEPPAPGSYELPPVGRVGAHELLGRGGEPEPLLALAPGESAFVSFVYLSCPEACPLATASLAELDTALAADPALRDRVQLVTVSFDPARDTPEAMERLRAGLAPSTDWRFLTAASPDAIAPVLRDFGQDFVVLRGPDGDWTGQLRHVLKVFLVDDRGRIRNVYSTGLLDPRLLRNDALTLLGEAAPAQGAP